MEGFFIFLGLLLLAFPVLAIVALVMGVGNRDRSRMLSQQLQQADSISPDYRTQASSLLNSTPAGFRTLQDQGYLQEYFRAYY